MKSKNTMLVQRGSCRLGNDTRLVSKPVYIGNEAINTLSAPDREEEGAGSVLTVATPTTQYRNLQEGHDNSAPTSPIDRD